MHEILLQSVIHNLEKKEIPEGIEEGLSTTLTKLFLIILNQIINL